MQSVRKHSWVYDQKVENKTLLLSHQKGNNKCLEKWWHLSVLRLFSLTFAFERFKFMSWNMVIEVPCHALQIFFSCTTSIDFGFLCDFWHVQFNFLLAIGLCLYENKKLKNFSDCFFLRNKLCICGTFEQLNLILNSKKFWDFYVRFHNWKKLFRRFFSFYFNLNFLTQISLNILSKCQFSNP